MGSGLWQPWLLLPGAVALHSAAVARRAHACMEEVLQDDSQMTAKPLAESFLRLLPNFLVCLDS